MNESEGRSIRNERQDFLDERREASLVGTKVFGRIPVDAKDARGARPRHQNEVHDDIATHAVRMEKCCPHTAEQDVDASTGAGEIVETKIVRCGGLLADDHEAPHHGVRLFCWRGVGTGGSIGRGPSRDIKQVLDRHRHSEKRRKVRGRRSAHDQIRGRGGCVPDIVVSSMTERIEFGVELVHALEVEVGYLKRAYLPVANSCSELEGRREGVN